MDNRNRNGEQEERLSPGGIVPPILGGSNGCHQFSTAKHQNPDRSPALELPCQRGIEEDADGQPHCDGCRQQQLRCAGRITEMLPETKHIQCGKCNGDAKPLEGALFHTDSDETVSATMPKPRPFCCVSPRTWIRRSLPVLKQVCNRVFHLLAALWQQSLAARSSGTPPVGYHRLFGFLYSPSSPAISVWARSPVCP